jgi:hypothetical protein
MFPDWPDLKTEHSEVVRQAIRLQTVARGPVAAMFRRLVVMEGRQVEYIYPDGSRQSIQLEKHEAAWRGDPTEAGKAAPEFVAKAVDGLATEAAKELETTIFGLLNRAPQGAGGRFGGESSDELVTNALETLRNMEMSFEDDEPAIFFATSPGGLQKFDALRAPEVEKMARDIIEEKRREWVRRESYRRLVD